MVQEVVVCWCVQQQKSVNEVHQVQETMCFRPRVVDRGKVCTVDGQVSGLTFVCLIDCSCSSLCHKQTKNEFSFVKRSHFELRHYFWLCNDRLCSRSLSLSDFRVVKIFSSHTIMMLRRNKKHLIQTFKMRYLIFNTLYFLNNRLNENEQLNIKGHISSFVHRIRHVFFKISKFELISR